jgi:hypothetical protein
MGSGGLKKLDYGHKVGCGDWNGRKEAKKRAKGLRRCRDKKIIREAVKNLSV